MLDPNGQVVFASERAEVMAESDDVWATVEQTAARAHRAPASAVVEVAVPDGPERLVTVAARRLDTPDDPCTVVWVIESDGDRHGGSGSGTQLDGDVALATVEEARARIDELVVELEDRIEEGERLTGIVEAMVHGLDAGVLVVDRSLVITDCSDRAARMVGVGRGDLVGRQLGTAIGAGGQELVSLVEPCLDSGVTHGLVHRPDGLLMVGCASYEASTKAVVVLQKPPQLQPERRPPRSRSSDGG